MAWNIKQHDTYPPYQVNLTKTVNAVVSNMDLTNATEVRFKMRKRNTRGVPKVNAVMTITDAPNGGVQHDWVPGDTDTAGTFDVEYEITWVGGGVQTVPNDSFNSVVVKADLDS